MNASSDLHWRIRRANQIYLHQSYKCLFVIFKLDDRKDEAIVLYSHFIFAIIEVCDVREEFQELVVRLPKSAIWPDLLGQPLSQSEHSIRDRDLSEPKLVLLEFQRLKDMAVHKHNANLWAIAFHYGLDRVFHLGPNAHYIIWVYHHVWNNIKVLYRLHQRDCGWLDLSVFLESVEDVIPVVLVNFLNQLLVQIVGIGLI